jgi:hypothetical protein
MWIFPHCESMEGPLTKKSLQYYSCNKSFATQVLLWQLAVCGSWCCVKVISGEDWRLQREVRDGLEKLIDSVAASHQRGRRQPPCLSAQ